MAQKQEKKLPGEVSWRVVDAWLAIPPCTYKTDPYCHVQCPYFYECYPDEEDQLLSMENYIVINGKRHDLMRQKGISCHECSLNGYCCNAAIPCSFFAHNDWSAMSEYYFVLHSNS